MIITETMLRSLIRESLLLEGPRDPGIFKAIFMAGCPGSGKGTVIRAIFGTDSGTTYQGLKIVNPDQLYEYLLSASDMLLQHLIFQTMIPIFQHIDLLQARCSIEPE